jgi:integrase
MARWNQVLAHLEEFFGSDPAREIPDRLEAYIVTRRQQGAKPATIRLELGVLSSTFKVAKLPRLEVPTIEIRNVRKGFLEVAEIRAITEHLPAPLQPAVWFAFFTGWRKGEVLGLTWSQVDFKAGVVRLEPGTTKSGRGRVFPFEALPALASLLRDQRRACEVLRAETGVAPWWVFHRAGRPIQDMDDAWRTACRKAGHPERIFHDLRRSAARNLRRLGLSESDIMEMCGWETRAMFQRYAIKDETGLADRLRRAVSENFGRTSAGMAVHEASKSSS